MWRLFIQLPFTKSLCGLAPPPPLCLSLSLSPFFTIYLSHQPLRHSQNTLTSFPLTSRTPGATITPSGKCLPLHQHLIPMAYVLSPISAPCLPLQAWTESDSQPPFHRIHVSAFNKKRERGKRNPKDLFLSYFTLKIWNSTVHGCTMGLSLDKLTRFRSLIFSSGAVQRVK